MSGKIIRLNDSNVRCPLCHGFFQKKYDEARHQFILACDVDMIAIAVGDPFIGKWDLAHARAGVIECPNCNAAMRFFCTSTGFVKSKCVKKKCGCTVSNSEPDRTEHNIATPDKPSVLQ